MSDLQNFWKPIINDFNPIGVVRSEDVERFFVDREEKDPSRSRLQWFKASLANSLGEQQPYKALLTGHVGSGKSWELMRVGQQVTDDFFVIWFDSEISLNSENANHFDVLLGMGVAIHAAAKAAQLKPDKKKMQSLINSFSTFVRKYTERSDFSLNLNELLKQVFVVAFVASAGVGGGPPAAIVAGAAAIAAKSVIKPVRLELGVNDELIRTLELPANRTQIMGALNDIIDDVCKKSKKPPLIIVDGLDKVSPTRGRILFAESALLAEPACALLYSAPIEFYHHTIAVQATSRFNDYRALQNPPVHKRPPIGKDKWRSERLQNEKGLSIMKEVVDKRLNVRELSLDQIITPSALTYLVKNSGGVMRDLIRYIRNAAMNAQLTGRNQIDEDVAQQVIGQHQEELAARLNITHRDILRDILNLGLPTGGEREEVEGELLRGSYLLSYQDVSDHWFDVHPCILPLL